MGADLLAVMVLPGCVMALKQSVSGAAEHNMSAVMKGIFVVGTPPFTTVGQAMRAVDAS